MSVVVLLVLEALFTSLFNEVFWVKEDLLAYFDRGRVW